MPTPPSQSVPFYRLVIGLCAFNAVSAIGGGIELIVWRRGNRYLSLDFVEHTPFSTLLVPGLLLLFVIGITSLGCAILCFRRSRAAIDATLVAGGALSVWIAAEVAMLRFIHWLHLIYGGVGVALCALGVFAAWRSGLPRQRWLILVTSGEALGFLVPGTTAVLFSRAGLGPLWFSALLVSAGFFEGLLLGTGQALAFPLPLSRRRYALFSALGASLAWASAFATVALIKSDVPVPVSAAAAVVAGCIGLFSIGSLQWLELRRRARRAQSWIGWTALAWVLALPLSFAPGPFVDERTPVASQIVLWGCGGLLMAYVMALVTWQGVRRLEPAG